MPFDRERLLRRLFAGCRLVTDLRVLERCQSSNAEAKALLEAGHDTHGTLFVAWEQVGGRGREKRDWWSGPAGANVAITLARRDPQLKPELFGLLGAVALMEVLQRLLGDPKRVALKWPNDVQLDGAKIAGFLAEQPAIGQGTLLLGLGCNLGAAPPDGTAPYPTTSLAEVLGERTPRLEDFLALWLWRFELGLRRFQAHGPADFEAAFLQGLQRWAPHGVRDPRDGRSGPLLEFSVSRGLRWGTEPDSDFRPPGWIPSLEALKP